MVINIGLYQWTHTSGRMLEAALATNATPQRADLNTEYLSGATLKSKTSICKYVHKLARDRY
jgi:hypothetical protein